MKVWGLVGWASSNRSAVLSSLFILNSGLESPKYWFSSSRSLFEAMPAVFRNWTSGERIRAEGELLNVLLFKERLFVSNRNLSTFEFPNSPGGCNCEVDLLPNILGRNDVVLALLYKFGLILFSGISRFVKALVLLDWCISGVVEDSLVSKQAKSKCNDALKTRRRAFYFCCKERVINHEFSLICIYDK